MPSAANADRETRVSESFPPAERTDDNLSPTKAQIHRALPANSEKRRNNTDSTVESNLSTHSVVSKALVLHLRAKSWGEKISKANSSRPQTEVSWAKVS